MWDTSCILICVRWPISSVTRLVYASSRSKYLKCALLRERWVMCVRSIHESSHAYQAHICETTRLINRLISRTWFISRRLTIMSLIRVRRLMYASWFISRRLTCRTQMIYVCDKSIYVYLYVLDDAWSAWDDSCMLIICVILIICERRVMCAIIIGERSHVHSYVWDDAWCAWDGSCMWIVCVILIICVRQVMCAIIYVRDLMYTQMCGMTHDMRH